MIQSESLKAFAELRGPMQGRRTQPEAGRKSPPQEVGVSLREQEL